MQPPISVSELNNQIKSLLESTFISVCVEGEVSRVTYHTSGHLYFTLKDKNSSISCVMFRGNNQKLKFRVEEGLKVIIQGAISVYTPRGNYQINCISMEPSGNGALALAYEQLKNKLQNKGYFKTETKKSLPKFPKIIALITSKTGAALQDMLRVAKKRWPLLKIILIDTLVQGDDAKYSIVKALRKADDLNVDLIVLSRGGGSLEDLWAFNEEMVADAIYETKTPIVSAVGHEIDFLISDFVADLRAPTPSAAMEMILPDKNEMFIYLDNLEDNFNAIVKRILLKKSEEIKNLYYTYRQNSFLQKITLFQNETALLFLRYNETLKFQLEKKYQKLSTLFEHISDRQKQIIEKKEQDILMILQTFKTNDPQKRVRESFAQITKDKKPIPIDLLKPDDIFDLISTKTKIKAKTISVTKL